MTPYKICKCGIRIPPEDIDSDYDRAWYPAHCEKCEERIQRNLVKITEVARESDEDECFRMIAWLTKRIEYLRGEDMKRLAGYHAN